MASRFEESHGFDFQSGKRTAPRLPLSLPGTFISTRGNHGCILLNLSRTGVLIAIKEPLSVGSDGFLRCGPIDQFVSVQRRGTGLNAMTFEITQSDAFVAKVRKFQENFANQELAELRSIAQDWAGA